MQGPSVFVDSDDDVLTIDKSDFSKPSFQIPSRPTVPPIGVAGPSLGLDGIINRRKVSSDVLSVSSGSSGRGSISGDSSVSGTTDTGNGSDGGYGGGNAAFSRPSMPVQRNVPQYDQYSDSGSEDDDEYDNGNGGGGNQRGDDLSNRISAERARMENEYNEKREILYQMGRLESRGYRLPRQFTMQSDLEEMRAEYHRILREKEIDASIKFQRKMLMAFVTGIEYLNTRFDPFDVRLNGWSEHVSDELDSYDDIFVELHDKYKSTGKKMAPELRLLLSLSGSAFMFHLTSSMFKQSQLPGVEEVLKANPELMRQFQQAAAQNVMGTAAMNSLNGAGGGPRGPTATAPTAAARGPGGGLFSMVGNLFGLGGGGGPPFPMPQPRTTVPQAQPQAPSRRPPMKMAGPSSEIEDVINELNAEITSRPPSNVNRIETMSVSDEEIMSIMEETTSVTSASKPNRRGRPQSNKRTLQL